MKKYIKTYINSINKEPEDLGCEVCRKKAVDIHHITARRMGGSSHDLIDSI